MLTSDFDFDLPEALIAQEPRPRGASRLRVVDRARSSWREAMVADLPGLLAPGDLLIVNDTRVFPARLIGRRDPSGGAVECLLLEKIDDAHWNALVHPGQKLKPGAQMVFEDASRAPGVVLRGTILERRYFGRRLIRLEAAGAPGVDAAVDALGHTPLPPYIHREDTPEDRERYQTIFARARGSVAAPTAGLHFDAALLEALDRAGVARAPITLHVGYGTFKPVRVERTEDHRVDAEPYDIPAATASAIDATRRAGHRIVAVGTTTTRALESAAEEGGRVRVGPGATDLFIQPGHEFRVVDALVTNFHLPRSSLLMLVAAFAGRDLILAAYREAVARGFHFYSYGDAMLVV
ncbi:MAG: tRNA preQ1(34) S-adenosylmethionine ribosyltransferase-isomerase QueA [Vicinamibacterales bacterium]